MARALRTTTFTEPKVLSDLLKHEYGTFCRDTGTIVSGAGVVNLGRVLGKITTGTATAAAKAGGNTGNGVFTIDATTPVLAGAKVGIYTVRCITAAANGGTFRVEDPDGIVIGDVAVGATFADKIKFAIADGSSDFVVGDGFDVTVAAGSGKWTSYDPTAVNGAQNAAAILLTGSIDATSADKPEAVLLVRGPAEIVAQELTWGAGVTTQGHKDTAVAALKALGIVVRAQA